MLRHTQADGPGHHKETVYLDYQSDSPVRLDKGFGMRQYHCPNLLLRDRFLIPPLIKAALIDFTGDLVGLHSMTGTGEEEYYGFGEFHYS